MGLVIKDPVPVHSQSIVKTDGSSSTLYNQNGNAIDGTLFRFFSSFDAMATLICPAGKARNEVELFLYYADKKTKGEPVSDGFNFADHQLGSIGV